MSPAIIFLSSLIFFTVGAFAVRHASAEKKPLTIFVSLIASILSAVIIVAIATSGGSAKFKSSVNNFSVLPDNYVRVFLSVKNIGDAPGSPSCTVIITATNAYGHTTGTGVDVMSGDHEVIPGGEYAGYMDILVTDDAAYDVTDKSMIAVSDC